jgi:hypothetical protein
VDEVRTAEPEAQPERIERRGGYRPGAGRKPEPRLEQDALKEVVADFKRAPGAMTKEAAREWARQTIIAGLGPMLRAQMAHAQGIGHCYTRDKNGKFSRVENLAEIDRLLAEGSEGEHYFIFAKDPSAVAFKELLDRALDKPKEQAQEIHVTGEIELSARLTAARARVIDVTNTLDVPPIRDGGPEGT